MKKHILLLEILLACLGSRLSNAQAFKNLDFEYGVYKTQPRKCAIEGDGESYSAILDSVNSKKGKRSLYVTLKNAEVFIFLSIPGQLVSGKDIQATGYFKSFKTDSLHAMLLFHNPVGGKPITSAPNTTSTEWQLISNRYHFPKDFPSDRLLIALTVNGTGSFWFDDVRIKIDGKNYGNGSPDFREPTKDEIEILNSTALPLKSLELQG
jgi:hypothetical protein